ncbi:2-dehydropantoate 2-reductase [Coniophora puteana RWD-64-598 SS2]|uniref:2-dehydropantoate 2-reductase n=1 Tax=Coniophora puteana (strain RWD-64-598) TaxID=741705 RepID=A0A5M3N6F5_CONPW|nr:2-dehydropantoate 2-reductase [Coniophora puteana RWD-64-598 SS2]EIW87022.1 2-dehydropantoate 2-reductase [Coniophora puteana RWD-64-598 SS2]
MRFHVLGVGAIGSLVAHHLRNVVPRENPVVLLHRTRSQAKRARVDHISTVKVETQGIVKEAQGFAQEVAEGGDAAKSDQDPIDSVIVTTKAHSTRAAIAKLLPRLSASSTVVLMQNGMGVYEELVEEVFKNPTSRPHFILCSNSHGAWLKNSFHSVHAGVGDLQLAVMPNRRNRDYEASLSSHTGPQFDKPLLSLDDITRSDDPSLARYHTLRNTVAALSSLSSLCPKWVPMSELQVILRRKLVANAAINPLTALMGCRNGNLFRDTESIKMLNNLCKEAEAVFLAERQQANEGMSDSLQQEVSTGHISPPSLDPRLRHSALVESTIRVSRTTGANISSMLSDVRRNLPTEIDYINGFLSNRGQHLGIPTPLNDALTSLVKIRKHIPLDQLM